MSRPSRGNSGRSQPSSIPIICPSSGTTSITASAPDDWLITFSWSPAVTVVTASVQYQIDGGGWNNLDGTGPVSGGFDEERDPEDLADPGSFLEFRAICTDVVGCPDFICVAAGAFVE